MTGAIWASPTSPPGLAGNRAIWVQSGFALLAPRQREFERDPEVLGALGYVPMTKQRNAEAVSLLARAVTFALRDVLLRLNLELDPTVRAAAIAARSSGIQPRSDK